MVLDDGELAALARMKRFFERCRADRRFREQLKADPKQAIAVCNLQLDPEDIRPVWDKDYFQQQDGAEQQVRRPLPRPMERFQEFTQEDLKWDEVRHHAASSPNAAYSAWQRRQLARCDSEFGKPFNQRIMHAPLVVELSKGCSVGCWFCGISAPRLEDHFLYDARNAELWRGVLGAIKDVVGIAGKAGFCYWATDPLDNPDYEQFCLDYHDVFGLFPQTTTAQPMKDPARIRRVLALSRDRGCKFNRFSILSLKILDRVFEEYTPEELAFVELVLQMDGGDGLKANAGRAKERRDAKPEKYQGYGFLESGTIACVSGFLFNMVDRSVKLISPCNADERWPLGYRVYAEGVFSDADELKTLLDGMIAQHMPLTVRPTDRLRFRRDLKFEPLEDGFRVATRFHARKFSNDPYLRQLGEIILQGDQTAEQIAVQFSILGISRSTIYETLDLLFQSGVLDDEPEPKPAAQEPLAERKTRPARTAQLVPLGA